MHRSDSNSPTFRHVVGADSVDINSTGSEERKKLQRCLSQSERIFPDVMETEPKAKAQTQNGKKQKMKQKQSKTASEKADQDKFNKLLDCCEEFLSAAMASGRDILKLLDPLISDTQCHIHSVLLLNILHKCYNKNEGVYRGVEKLEDKERKILSYGVLFTLMKHEYKDELGFVVHEVSLNNFNRSILNSRNREKYYTNNAKAEFNSCSVEFIKSVASDEIRDIFTACQAVSQISHLKFLPCYPSLHAVIDYVKSRSLPIILSLVRINKKITPSSKTEYNMKSIEVRFHEFREDRSKFVYKKELSESERKIPTITFCCYSLVTEGAQEFSLDYDVRDLLMLCSASHIQLPRNSKLPVGYKDAEEYVRHLYKKDANVSIEYNKHYELAKKQNLIDARYSTILRSSVEQRSDEISITVERRQEDTLFSVDHVYLSNYHRECQRLKGLDFNSKLDRTQVFKLNTEKVHSEASIKFSTAIQCPGSMANKISM